MNLSFGMHFLVIFLLTLLNLCSASSISYPGPEAPLSKTVLECLSSLLDASSFCAHYLLPYSDLSIQLSLCGSDPIAVRNICTSLLAKVKPLTNTNTTTYTSSDESGTVSIFSSSSKSGDYEADDVPKYEPHEYASNHHSSYEPSQRHRNKRRSTIPPDPPTFMESQNSNGKTEYKTVNVSPISNHLPNPNSQPDIKSPSAPKMNFFIKPPSSSPHHLSPPNLKDPQFQPHSNSAPKRPSSIQSSAKKVNPKPIKPLYRPSRIKLTGHPAGGQHTNSASAARGPYRSQSASQNKVETANEQETDSDAVTIGEIWEKGIRQRRRRRKLHLQNKQPRIYEEIAANVERDWRRKEDWGRRVLQEETNGNGVGIPSTEEDSGVGEEGRTLERGTIGGKRMNGPRIQLY